jgi:quercetin dioxygenase-like cupin family protein
MQRPHPFLVIAALSFSAGAALMWGQQQSPSATRREEQFANDHVRVWKSIIMPKQPLVLHRHEHGRVLIAVTDGQLKVVDQDGKPLGSYDWKAGKAYWLDADPPGQLHADVNESTRPIEVIVVELKKD